MTALTLDTMHRYFADGARPEAEFAIGLESELHGLDKLAAPDYESIAESIGIFTELGWAPVYEKDNIIGAKRAGESIALEPGGQFEFASAPLTLLSEVETAYTEFLQNLSKGDTAWLSAGMRPFGMRSDIPWMPKGRYKIMRNYMPKVGTRGLEMMQRTGTVQVNLDYGSEFDASRKMELGLRMGSTLTGIFASSPIVDGEVTSYQSYRAHIWLDTDNQRCGLIPHVVADGALFKNYTQWALDVPMYFIYRDGYVDATETTFRKFWKDGFKGYVASEEDWETHLATLFPEARLKRFIEIRSCDAGSKQMNLAFAALTSGLFYSDDALTASLDLLKRYSFEEVARWRNQVPTLGLNVATSDGATLWDIAKKLLGFAGAALDNDGKRMLNVAREVVESKRSYADRIVDVWKHSSSNEVRKNKLADLNLIVA